MNNPDTIRLNWKPMIECIGCGTRFDVGNVDPSVTRVGKSSRMIMLTVPNECQECHNIRVVTTSVAEDSRVGNKEVE